MKTIRIFIIRGVRKADVQTYLEQQFGVADNYDIEPFFGVEGSNTTGNGLWQASTTICLSTEKYSMLERLLSIAHAFSNTWLTTEDIHQEYAREISSICRYLPNNLIKLLPELNAIRNYELDDLSWNSETVLKWPREIKGCIDRLAPT